MVCHCLHICSHFLTSFRSYQSPSCSFSGDALTISSSQKPSSFRASNWGWNCYGSRSEGPRSRHSRWLFAPVGESIIERCPDVCATESASCRRFMFIQSFVCLIWRVCRKTTGIRRSSKNYLLSGLWLVISHLRRLSSPNSDACLSTPICSCHFISPANLPWIGESWRWARTPLWV